MGLNFFNKKQENREVVQRPVKNIDVERRVITSNGEYITYRINDISKLTQEDISKFKPDDMFVYRGEDNLNHYLKYDEFIKKIGTQPQVIQSVPKATSLYVGSGDINTYDIIMNAYKETAKKYSKFYNDKSGEMGIASMAEHLRLGTIGAINGKFNSFTGDNGARENLINLNSILKSQGKSLALEIAKTINEYMKAHGEQMNIDFEKAISEFVTLFLANNYENYINGIDIDAQQR